PGMTGVEFLRHAKELYPSTVRMVLSGYTELQSITDAINEGAIYKFLTKPWDDERLRDHVLEAFQSKELADENKRLSGVVNETNRELAQVNRRLQQLLQVQRERISREEVSLHVVRSLLESIPVPIIGGDINGMISYLNEQAEQLFVGQPTLVGRYVTEALTEPLRQLWAAEDGASTQVELAGRRYQALLRNLSGENFPGGERGRLLVLMPIFSEEVAA
ncbi:MAG: hypothetical protein IV107_04935, partial [Paucibacter sp.]|nr:hypothetical protein [Roseateles sp.]